MSLLARLDAIAGNGRADLLAKDPRPDAEKVDELFMWAFSRRPSAEHRQVVLHGQFAICNHSLNVQSGGSQSVASSRNQSIRMGRGVQSNPKVAVCRFEMRLHKLLAPQ